MKVYRICERKNGTLYTLFHKIQNSREMPLNIWLTSETKQVRDGSKGKWYTSGFHCLKDIDECRDFIKKFSRPRDMVLVECEVKGIRKKEHSRYNVLLTKKMKLNRIIEKLKIKS